MRQPDYDIFAVPEDEQLILSGPPQELTGRVELHNPGKVNIIIRDAGLKDPSRVLISQPLRHALPALVLRPDQGRTLPLTVAIDKKTPPGVYHVDLVLAGQSRPAVLNVTEVFDLTIQPRSLVVANLAGMVQRKQLIVTNEGNVAFTIGDIGEVDLKDDMVWDRAVRLAVEQITDKANLDIEELVVAVLRVTRENAYRPGSLLVRNASGKVEVMPGERATIDLEITLREELPFNSRYRGITPLLTQDIEFIVVSSSGSGERARPSTPARRATKTSERTTSVPRKTTAGRRGKK